MHDVGVVLSGEYIARLEGYFGTVAYQLKSAAKYLPTEPGSIAPGLLGWVSLPIVPGSKLLFRGLAALFYVLDERSKFTAQGFPKNYVVIARKPNA
jgi:hypothetical protein